MTIQDKIRYDNKHNRGKGYPEFLFFYTITQLSSDYETSKKIIQRIKRVLKYTHNKGEDIYFYGVIEKTNESNFWHAHFITSLFIKRNEFEEYLKRAFKRRSEIPYYKVKRVYNVSGVLTYMAKGGYEYYTRKVLD